MIYTNIYPPQKLSVKHILSSLKKQDLSDFLSQWYLKNKPIKTKKEYMFFLQRSYSFVLVFSLKKNKLKVYKMFNYKPMLKTFLCKWTFFSPFGQHLASYWSTQ